MLYKGTPFNKIKVKEAIKAMDTCDLEDCEIHKKIAYDMVCFLGGDKEIIIAFLKTLSPDEIDTLSYVFDELSDRFRNDDFTDEIYELFFNKYRKLIRYVDIFKEQPVQGEWIFDSKSKGTHDDPIQMPYIKFTDTLLDFIADFDPFMDSNYQETLEQNNLNWSYSSITAYNIEMASETLIIAFITAIIRAERFSDGVLLKAISEGYMLRWMERLFSIE